MTEIKTAMLNGKFGLLKHEAILHEEKLKWLLIPGIKI